MAETLKKGPGGARKGAGMPKGTITAKTLDKVMAREELRRLVLLHMPDLVAAQVANAKGLKYLVVRDKTTGKFSRVTEALARQLEGDSEVTIEVWEKDPSIAAFTDLMNRALDKPQEQQQDVRISGTLTLEQIVAGSMKPPEK